MSASVFSSSRSTHSSAQHYLRLGWGVIVVGFMGFLIWAALAPLDRGVSADGTVVVSGNRKSIQPFYSGVVADVLVQEGEWVELGQPLLQLDTTQVQKEVDSARYKVYMAMASQARLLAETACGEDNHALTFPPALHQAATTYTAASVAMSLQERLFISREQACKAELASINASLQSASTRLKGLANLMDNFELRQQQMQERIAAYELIESDGFISKHSLFELRDTYAQLLGESVSTQAEWESTQAEVTELRAKREFFLADYQQQINTELAQVTLDIQTYQSTLAAAEFQLAHSQVQASSQGYIVGLATLGQGSVISEGQVLMDILPDTQRLQVDVKLPVHLIDSVHASDDVDLLFTAFNLSQTPKVTGKVIRVAPDRLIDEQTQQPYYSTRVMLDERSLVALNGLQVQAGMPVQVFIRNGERSLLSYLFKPFTDRMPMAFADG